MVSDKLYELAFQYKRTKLWKTVWDTELFAVRLPDGQIGYISIMGEALSYCALGLYIGEDGFNSFLTVLETAPFLLPQIEDQEKLMQMEFLQCTFESKDELSDEEREAAKRYARAHGIRISGANAYPKFMSYRPYHAPWSLQTEAEEENLCAALAAAMEIARLLEKQTAEELGLEELTGQTKEILLLEPKDGGYELGKTVLPERRPKKYPVPENCNDVFIANLKKIKRKGCWECELFHYPEAVWEKSEEIPSYPAVLMAIESSTEYVLPLDPVLHYEEKPEVLLNEFMESLIQYKTCPAEIKVRNERTLALVEEFCRRLKIKVSIVEELPVLDDAELSLMDYARGDDACKDDAEDLEKLQSIVKEMLQMDDKQCRAMPPAVKEVMKELLLQEFLPDDMADALKQKLFGKPSDNSAQTKKGKKVHSGKKPQSYVISVSLGTGCYRHIQISGSSTLFQLHEAILDAFGFIDDHAHAFFLDNISWSEQDSYYAEGIESGDRTTEKYRLNQVGLYKGQRFKYVFDFGEEWTFQCRVLRVTEGSTEPPAVIRCKGTAPEQYGGWDDDWDEDWDENEDGDER